MTKGNIHSHFLAGLRLSIIYRKTNKQVWKYHTHDTPKHFSNSIHNEHAEPESQLSFIGYVPETGARTAERWHRRLPLPNIWRKDSSEAILWFWGWHDLWPLCRTRWCRNATGHCRFAPSIEATNLCRVQLHWATNHLGWEPSNGPHKLKFKIIFHLLVKGVRTTPFELRKLVKQWNSLDGRLKMDISVCNNHGLFRFANQKKWQYYRVDGKRTLIIENNTPTLSHPDDLADYGIMNVDQDAFQYDKMFLPLISYCHQLKALVAALEARVALLESGAWMATFFLELISFSLIYEYPRSKFESCVCQMSSTPPTFATFTPPRMPPGNDQWPHSISRIATNRVMRTQRTSKRVMWRRSFGVGGAHLLRDEPGQDGPLSIQ